MTSPADLPSHFTRNWTRWQEAGAAGAILFACALIVFWPQLVGGEALYFGDIGLYFTPQETFVRETLRAGRLPLWNPLIYCGTPLVGNPQSWLLYPFSMLLPALSVSQFLNWTIAAHVWLAGVGMFALLRHNRTVGFSAALLGAATFAFGGQLVSKEQFPNMVQASAWLPWILWLTGRLAARARTGDALALGAALGLQLLAAHAQISLLTVYLALAYGLWTARRARRKWNWRLAGLALTAGIVAVGLAAGALLPTAELVRDATHQRLSFAIVNRFYLPVSQLTNFVLPTLHGHPYWNDFTARGNFWETCCYVGVIPFGLALAGAAAGRRQAQTRFWLVVFLAAVLLAMGRNGGLYYVCYAVLPGFRAFHDPARCLLWAALALSALTALGAEAALSRMGARRGLVAAVLFALAVADLGRFDRTLYPLTAASSLSPRTPFMAALASEREIQSGQARYLAPDSAWTWRRFSRPAAFRRDVPDFQSLWADTLTPNLGVVYGLPNAYGYEPVARRDSQRIVGTAVSALRGVPAPTRRKEAATWAGFLAVRDVLSATSAPSLPFIPGLSVVAVRPTLSPTGTLPTTRERIVLLRNARWQPRARIVTQWRVAANLPAARAVMSRALENSAGLDLTRSVVVTGTIPFASSPGPVRPAALREDGPNRLVVTAQTDRPALLVVADTQAPGWRAVLDGRPVPILSANVCLRAVALPQAGRHAVTFSYVPTAFRLGLYLSLLTAGGLAGAAAQRLRTRKQAGRTFGRRARMSGEGNGSDGA